MSFVKKLKERVDSVKVAMAATRLSLDELIVTSTIKEERMAICNSCEFLFEPTMQCRKCGCFVKAKTAFAPFKCPIGKWPAIDVDENRVIE